MLYFGYKFNDSIILNSEIEFEHSSTPKSGSVSVEMMALDFLIDPLLNVRAGLMLAPMGFVNLIHALSAPDGMIVSRRRREICQSEV
ncbi:hypothetical protein BMR09_11455, partial [Methylococcaceae bacterium CS3]